MYSPRTCFGSNLLTKTCSALWHYCEDGCHVGVGNLDTVHQAAKKKGFGGGNAEGCVKKVT